MDAIQRGSLRDPALAEAFYRVAQMLDEPTALLSPAIVWRVLTARFRSAQPALPAPAALRPAAV